MRIVVAVLGALALMSFPAHAAWLVKLKTGEQITVQGFWRDGDKTHLTRGGVDMIVDTDRIESMEDGAPEPDTTVQSATARTADGEGTAAAAPAPSPAAADGAPAETETSKAYRERIGEMTTEDLQAEERDRTKSLLAAQEARFQAKFGGSASKEQREAIEKRFHQAQQRESVAETALKARGVQP
jgi:hypothetical protein